LKECTSGCVAIKSQISLKLVTQGICHALGGGKKKKNSGFKMNSQLKKHVTLECHKLQNIRYIESTSQDFMTIP